jgi:hypothetical protein
MPHEIIQQTLTYLIEVISTVGFTIIWIQYTVSITLKEIDSWGTIQPISEPEKETKIICNRDSKPLNNELTINLIHWEAFNNVSNSLDKFKMSELKEIASEIPIKGYRKMKKLELALEILQAHERAPIFSE